MHPLARDRPHAAARASRCRPPPVGPAPYRSRSASPPATCGAPWPLLAHASCRGSHVRGRSWSGSTSCCRRTRSAPCRPRSCGRGPVGRPGRGRCSPSACRSRCHRRARAGRSCGPGRSPRDADTSRGRRRDTDCSPPSTSSPRSARSATRRTQCPRWADRPARSPRSPTRRSTAAAARLWTPFRTDGNHPCDRTSSSRTAGAYRRTTRPRPGSRPSRTPGGCATAPSHQPPRATRTTRSPAGSAVRAGHRTALRCTRRTTDSRGDVARTRCPGSRRQAA